MYIEQIEQKHCSKCKQYLDLSKFEVYKPKDKYTYRHICKICRSIEKKKYRDDRKGTLNVWLNQALVDSKKRAIAKGLEHNLTKEWILANLPKTCPVLNIELSFTGNRNTTPSLDRFDNTKGYTTDNVRIISCKANRLKSNASVEELEAIVRYMKNEQVSIDSNCL